MQININTDAFVVYTNKLEKVGRSALPNAVRETLSAAALNVKQRTMPREASREFVARKRNFFKANSSVDFAKGKNIDSMKSTVGFLSTKLVGQSNYAVKDLQQQEYGGKIDGRNFIPLDSARVGGSRKRSVKRGIEKIRDIKQIIRANGKGTKKQRWIRAAFVAGAGGFVLGNKKGGRQTLSRIDMISSGLKSKKLEIKRTPVYSYKKGGIKPTKSTGFMRRASYESAMNMDLIYITEARKQLERLMK